MNKLEESYPFVGHFFTLFLTTYLSATPYKVLPMRNRDPKLSLYRSCRPVVETEFRVDGSRSLTEALVEAVAEAEGVDSIELPPLYETIDLDTLSQLFTKGSQTAEKEILLGLRIDTWNVFISSDRRILVCDATESIALEPVFETGIADPT